MADEPLRVLVIMAMDAFLKYKRYHKLMTSQCDEIELYEFYLDCYERLALPYLEELEDRLEDIRDVVCGSVNTTLK